MDNSWDDSSVTVTPDVAGLTGEKMLAPEDCTTEAQVCASAEVENEDYDWDDESDGKSEANEGFDSGAGD